MKACLAFLFCLVSGLAQAQAPAPVWQLDAATQRFTCAETVEVPGASQADLYARAQAWLATAYQTTPTGAPKTAGVVQGTGWREIEMAASEGEGKSTPLNLWYTITLAVQPGRYRYAISEFQTQPEPTPAEATPAKQAIELVLRREQALPPPRTDYAHQAAGAAQGVADTLKESMADPAGSTQADTR